MHYYSRVAAVLSLRNIVSPTKHLVKKMRMTRHFHYLLSSNMLRMLPTIRPIKRWIKSL